jgi:hypothetical protein
MPAFTAKLATLLESTLVTEEMDIRLIVFAARYWVL